MSGNSKNTGQKRSSSNSAEEYRRYLIRVMRTEVGDISPDDELCQSRKQITGEVRSSALPPLWARVVLPSEPVHQYLDRF
jgi:hypothetical protein